jgi:hypothetical protein
LKEGSSPIALTFLSDGQVKTAGQAVIEDLQLSAGAERKREKAKASGTDGWREGLEWIEEGAWTR